MILMNCPVYLYIISVHKKINTWFGELKMNGKCEKCGCDLTNFIGYIASEGELCIKCYNEYMAEEEFRTLLPKVKSSAHHVDITSPTIAASLTT